MKERKKERERENSRERLQIYKWAVTVTVSILYYSNNQFLPISFRLVGSLTYPTISAVYSLKRGKICRPWSHGEP